MQDRAQLYADNQYIKIAVANSCEVRTEQSIDIVMRVLFKRMLQGGAAPTPVVDANHVLDNMDKDTFEKLGPRVLEQGVRLKFDLVKDSEGGLWVPLFTDEGEMKEGNMSRIIMNAPIEHILRNGLNDKRLVGVVINPYTQSMTFDKEALAPLMERFDRAKEQLKKTPEA